MRSVRYTGQFKRDYRREKSGRHRRNLEADLEEAVRLLAGKERLPQRYFDHALSGEWRDFRDCHIGRTSF